MIQALVFHILELDKDPVGFFLGLVFTGFGPGHGRGQDIGNVLDTQAQVRRLVPVHMNFPAGRARFAADVNIRNPRNRFNEPGRSLCKRCQDIQIEPPDFHIKALFPAQDPFHDKLTLGGPSPDGHSRNLTVQALAQIPGNIDVGTVPLGSGGQRDPDFGFGGVTGPVSGRTDTDHGGDRLRDGRINNGLHPPALAVHQVQPGAHLHFAGDPHLPFITGRKKFRSDFRNQHQCRAQSGDGDH